jgi:Ser/Thr protein kinase RdoA (MazF antagonist)
VDAAAILFHYDGLAGAPVGPLGAGLVNQTFLVRAARGRFVLQRLSSVFSPLIHENIRAVTARLTEVGMVTPQLVPTASGKLWVDAGAQGVWRVMTYVDGQSFEVARNEAQAHSAGALLARFHRALEGLSHAFVGLRPGVHDTAAHFERLRQSVDAHPGHRLFAEVSALAKTILSAADALPPLPKGPSLVCHGDPKFNNIIFSSALKTDEAVCFVDLDGVGPSQRAFELGDAWRSWCNRHGEDAPEAALDPDVFRDSLDGYRAGLGRPLLPDEARALLLGVEWVSLELAARFAADALVEAYFGWDPARFPARGEHNLARARGQYSLHAQLVGARGLRASLLGVA